jgi:3-hydroxybutyryl-CoA dehydratase
MPTGLYFEDLEIGQTLTTRGRTITETDVVNFAGLSGDYNPLHTNAEFARNTEYGQRVAHGALGFSIAIGLSYQLGFLEGTVMAFLEMAWRYSLPIFIGDTITCEIAVKALKAMPRLGGGKVILEVKVLNQAGKVTQKGDWTILVRSRPEEKE